MPTPSERRYEFDEAQNATFASLATAMTFVAHAMVLLGVGLGVAAAALARSTLTGSALLAPVVVAVVVMAVQLYGAAGHFRRIARTRGSDIRHLMMALNELIAVYRVQRWLWTTALAIVVVALATTIVSR